MNSCARALLSLCSVLCLAGTSSSETVNLPKAVDITWSSINFKTILEWNPKPSNYTYTVEVSSPLSNWMKKCQYVNDTECDVTSLLKDVNRTYTARVISEVRATDNIEEFPYSQSPEFTPYEQTILGKPVIESFDLKKDSGKLHVLIKDALTPYRFGNQSFMTVRDIFKNDFVYTVFYRKASSSGKKQESSPSNEIVVNVEKGESYCFFVKATIPSRKTNRDSQDSDEKCTESGGNNASPPAAKYLYLCSLILLYWLL
ncbi:tissue factor isoform X2 [Spea bombifrons]|uniref:tissue factor isoform X2 n=1 Tax=Spea bombifrons TaxID=233779 RepID=UPI002349AF21|nr:tissue factor isoform X2 [Spea bombifrons]